MVSCIGYLLTLHERALTTVTGTYRTQYLVKYGTIGNVLTSTVPADEWVNLGSAAKGTFRPTIANHANDTQCLLVKDNRTSTISAPITIIANYQTQYKLTFNQIGIESDVKGIILTIFGNEENYSQLATTIWVNNLAPVSFTFADNIPSTIANKLYILTGTNATSPITIDMPTLIQGNYKPQYSSSLFTIAEFFLIFLALLLLLLLLLSYRRRRKKKQAEKSA
jgi:hypothetical protein